MCWQHEVVMKFFFKLFEARKSETRTTTLTNPLRVSAPSIGFLNLDGETGAALAAEDSKVLAPLFKQTVVSTEAAPECEVIFIYVSVGAEGKSGGTRSGIRELIKAAGAFVAVVATENSPDRYLTALGARNDWGANIVLVIDRKDRKFAIFCARLFEAMFKGESMLSAWVKLAPQIPGVEHPDAPGTIMLAEAGHITFAK
jgi:hypothetical protein